MTKKNKAGMSATDYAISLGEEPFDTSKPRNRKNQLQLEFDNLYSVLIAGKSTYNQPNLKQCITRYMPFLSKDTVVWDKVELLLAQNTSWGRDKFMVQLCNVLGAHFNVVISLRKTKR